jgi:hypothetical protein
LKGSVEKPSQGHLKSGALCRIMTSYEMKIMPSVRAQQVWEAFKGELIDNGLKDSEDVRQGLSTAIREVADRLCTDVGEMECFIEVVRQIADEVDAL